jgi:pyruvate, water dikinase
MSDFTCNRCTPRTTVLVSGRSAVPGCVTGIARVVLDPDSLGVVSNGDVLVMPMTDPSATPAIGRAAAVVTDRGGILCHAAVVCREFGKPCVVGTRRATTLIRDGDVITVCATRGLVLAN